MDIQHELKDEERSIVAARLLDEQRERFDGVRKAAYTAAGVNPATWTRAVDGVRVRPDRMVAIVKSLWPQSRGEWSRVPERTTPRTNPAYRGPTWVADADEPWTPGLVALKDYVDESIAEANVRSDELEDRVIELERMLLNLVESEDDPPTLQIVADSAPDENHGPDVDAAEAKPPSRPVRRQQGPS